VHLREREKKYTLTFISIFILQLDDNDADDANIHVRDDDDVVGWESFYGHLCMIIIIMRG
jgi:hypothetical protein